MKANDTMQLLVPTLPALAEVAPFLAEIDQSHIYSNDGPLNRRFCGELSGFFERRLPQSASVHLTTVANGTVALELALRSYVKPDRPRVMLPSYTFIATAHAVRNAGFEPFFVDVDENSLALSPDIAEAALPEAGPLAAVIAVSPFGGPVDVPSWEAFEERHGVPVVFDFAAAATSIAHVGRQSVCLSLHATKIIGIGEGGAVMSTDLALTERVKSLASFGFEPGTRVSVQRGGNYRVSEYAAALGLASLAGIERKISALCARADTYRTHLEKSDIALQDGFGRSWVAVTMNLILPEMQVPAILARLEADGVPWRRWYGLGCHEHPAFAADVRSALPTTSRVAARTIGVPFHELLRDDEIERVCRLVRDA